MTEKRFHPFAVLHLLRKTILVYLLPLVQVLFARNWAALWAALVQDVLLLALLSMVCWEVLRVSGWQMDAHGNLLVRWRLGIRLDRTLRADMLAALTIDRPVVYRLAGASRLTLYPAGQKKPLTLIVARDDARELADRLLPLEQPVVHRPHGGEKMVFAVLGANGCGKSTIAALLSGSRTGYTGSVTLGGVPVQELQQEQRLRTLTLVPHNATIFKGTVESNLRMAKPDAVESELWAALEQVNLADFCRSQNGLQTALHEGGSNLSGGQRQRLAMARALLHDTPIYLFDEATSNVDAESENDIMAAIRSLAGRKTVILISHRLANVVDSDCIYVLDKGRIAERGTHAELLKKQGAYSRLYTAQKQLETLETEDA